MTLKEFNKSIIAGVIMTFVVFYTFMIGYFYFNQRNLIFEPQKRTSLEIYDFADKENFSIIDYATEDGLILRALFKRPQDGKPIIMFFNGNAGKVERANYAMTPVMQNGYGVFINIYRGYGFNEGDPSEEKFFKDGQKAYDYIVRAYPHNDIIFYGYSMGSGTATYLASKNKNNGLIIEAGFSSVLDIAKEKYPFLPVGLMLKDKFLSDKYIKDVHSNILIMHGLKDPVIDLRFAKKLGRFAPKATFITYEEGDHTNLHVKGADKDIIDWIGNL